VLGNFKRPSPAAQKSEFCNVPLMSARPAPDDAESLPSPLPEPRPITFSVVVHSVEGLTFLTELGVQQIGISILFPSHTLDLISPLSPPGPRVAFEFSETFDLMLYPQSTVNALLANPLEFFLYICTPDMKKQAQVARFIFPFDQLFFDTSVSQAIEGKVLPEGAAFLSPDGLKANVECSWSEPIFAPEDRDEAMIATFSVSGVYSTPLAMINCTTQPNNATTHIFFYSLYAEMPDGHILLMEDGRFTSSTPDGADASVQFNALQKFYVTPAEMEKWKEAAESAQIISFYLKPDLNDLLQALGIVPDQYSALFACAEFPLAHFAKPGRCHFQQSLALLRDFNYAEHQQGAPLMSPTGFPPEPVPEANSKKKTPARRPVATGRTAQPKGKSAPTTPGKKPRALSAKDKKVLAQLQNCLQFDPSTDYFKESTTQLRLEVSLSRPIFPRPATPASTKTPEEIVEPLPKLHEFRLAQATEEFCRQLNLAIDRLETAYRDQVAFQPMQNLIKESLKPSIVEIVKQIFLGLPPNSGPAPKVNITQAFISELRTFLVTNLFKALNTRFDLAFPRAPPTPPEMNVEQITRRLGTQTYHKTYDNEALHMKRCELDPLNPKWPFELALYYNDQNSPQALECFAKAISVDYNFTAAILGFSAQLAENGNREDCVVLLTLLDQRKPDDPTVTACLLILYQLIESSKADQFLAKVSQMSLRLPKSPTIIAADSMLDVHDTFLSEMMLTREQLQSGRSKELLILLARFTQQTREFSRAQEYLKEAIELDREDLSLWKMLGSFQYAGAEFDKAQASFEQLLALAEAADPEVCLKLALVYIMKRKYDKAYDLLMYTVERLEVSVAWTALGVCCLRLGDFEEAEVALGQANQMDRWDATTWGYCAVLCGKMGRWIEGEQAVSLAARLKLRDFRLIKEIIELYDELAKGEETGMYLTELRNVQEADCHRSLEVERQEGAPDDDKEAEDDAAITT
jgi:tetratricopeptide (TPR) repeat protein